MNTKRYKILNAKKKKKRNTKNLRATKSKKKNETSLFFHAFLFSSLEIQISSFYYDYVYCADAIAILNVSVNLNEVAIRSVLFGASAYNPLLATALF